MADTTPTILRAQLTALESMYASERRCENARRILDLVHTKRDELSVAMLAVDRAALDTVTERVAA